MGEEKALPYNKMPINKGRRYDGIRESLVDNHLIIIQAININ